jgi:hypothetical protein
MDILLNKNIVYIWLNNNFIYVSLKKNFVKFAFFIAKYFTKHTLLLIPRFGVFFIITRIVNTQSSLVMKYLWFGLVGLVYVWFTGYQGEGERIWMRWLADTEIFLNWREITFFGELFSRLFFLLLWVSCFFS